MFTGLLEPSQLLAQRLFEWPNSFDVLLHNPFHSILQVRSDIQYLRMGGRRVFEATLRVLLERST